MSDVLADAAAANLDDYFQIAIGDADGRTFESVKPDIGFADPWLGSPVEVKAPSLLGFAGIPSTTVRAIPAEQHLAEKIHAYTKSYGSPPCVRMIWYRQPVSGKLMMGPQGAYHDQLLEQRHVIGCALTDHRDRGEA